MPEHRPDERRPAGHRSDGHPPDSETVSAWLDGELDEAARRRFEAHLAACPACAAQVAALRGLAAGFASMRAETLGYDLAGVLDGRLAAAAPRRPRTPRRWLVWLPATLGAAASLALGIGLGSALPGAAAAAPPALVGAMRVFDPMPPGSVCLGPDPCYTKGMPR
ncbi:MAG: zf-HC2 domain-containing protein [Rhodocyclaceae bacterium]|nr:zf-HC2 domain-containing protein [Rhodocyclaceae bacterium]